MTKNTLQVTPDGGSPIIIPFESEDSILEISQKIIAVLLQKKRGPRKAKPATGAAQ